MDTNCTTLSLIPTVNGNTVRSFSTHGHQSAAKGSSTTVSRSDTRLMQHLDSSALGLVCGVTGAEGTKGCVLEEEAEAMVVSVVSRWTLLPVRQPSCHSLGVLVQLHQSALGETHRLRHLRRLLHQPPPPLSVNDFQ